MSKWDKEERKYDYDMLNWGDREKNESTDNMMEMGMIWANNVESSIGWRVKLKSKRHFTELDEIVYLTNFHFVE